MLHEKASQKVYSKQKRQYGEEELGSRESGGVVGNKRQQDGYEHHIQDEHHTAKNHEELGYAVGLESHIATF